jgi:hypothetical protein
MLLKGIRGLFGREILKLSASGGGHLLIVRAITECDFPISLFLSFFSIDSIDDGMLSIDNAMRS